jgi:hypothetical protein
VGSLLVIIFSQVSSGMLQASLIEQEEALKTQTEETQTPESPVVLESHELAEA